MSQLPALRNPLAAKPMQSLVGPYADPCAGCALAEVCVGGCCGQHAGGPCAQERCFGQCGDCGGSAELKRDDPVVERTGVPAVCSKSPLRELYLDQVRKETYRFVPQPSPRFKQKAIVVTTGRTGDTIHEPHPAETEVVAVNLRHVWSTNGWFSRDLKDYLRLAPKTKLILLTAMPDNYLEQAWHHEVMHEDFRALGADYWQPLEYSPYDQMSHYNNLWANYRTMFCLEASRGHFSFTPTWAADLTKPSNLGPFLDMARAIPTCIQNVQGMNIRTTEGHAAFLSLMARLRRWQQVVGKRLTFVFIGVVSQLMVANVTQALPGNDCYFLSAAPWILALRGRKLSREAKKARSSLSRQDLLLLNQRNYVHATDHTISAIRRKAG